MKRSLAAVAAAATLAFTLTACFGPGDAARGLAQTWLDGDASVQCHGQPAPWSSFELGDAQLLESDAGSEMWTVEIAGVRSMAPVSGHVFVEIREDGDSCVAWTEQ